MNRRLLLASIPVLALFLLAACSGEQQTLLPAPDGQPVLALRIDPQTQQVTTIETTALPGLGAAALPGQDLVNAFLGQASFAATFAPGNRLIIEASFTNVGAKTLVQAFTFETNPATGNIDSSTEPTVSDADLGGNGRLAPGEISSVLTFEVIHKGSPFSYFVDAYAVVTDPLLLPDLGPGPNCYVDEFSVPGQGLRALESGLRALESGLNAQDSVGGLFLLGPDDPDPTNNTPIRLVEPTEVGAFVQQIDGASGPERSVAIMVVDNFQAAGPNPVFELGPDVFNLPNLIGTGDFATAFQALVDTNQFSHGALVMQQILELLAGAGFDQQVIVETVDGTNLVQARAASSQLSTQDESSLVVVVVPVDTEGLDTDVISSRIQEGLYKLDWLNYESDLGIHGVAINMSFVLAPCSVTQGFDTSGLDTFEAYVEALGEDNGLAPGAVVQLARDLLAPVDARGGGEPLLDLIGSGPYCEEGGEGCPGESLSSIIYVGSAGNFGQDFPLLPAALPQVVSSSSQDAAEPSGFSAERSSFSNSGEVMAPGALYQLSIDGSNTPQWALGYAGTSFSAPAVTLFTALDLMRGSPQCALANSSELAHNDPDAYNTLLADAVSGFCLVP